MEAQHTLEWYRKRLGKITGSEVGTLMKKGKSEAFSDTAKSYLYQLSAERSMNPAIVEDDQLFEEYLYQVNISSKAMRWGNEQESKAREIYNKITRLRMVETGFCEHPTIPNFGSSPDGFHYDKQKGTLEIKCPDQCKYMRYRHLIKDNASLLSVAPKYFYQCMSHIMCTGTEWNDFVVFNPFQLPSIHIVRIYPDENVFAKMEECIQIANDHIDHICSLKQ